MPGVVISNYIVLSTWPPFSPVCMSSSDTAGQFVPHAARGKLVDSAEIREKKNHKIEWFKRGLREILSLSSSQPLKKIKLGNLEYY